MVEPVKTITIRPMQDDSFPHLQTEDVLRLELDVLRAEHRDLDHAIDALIERRTADQLTLQRLKKKKLALKDKITQIEDRLLPDIIA